jgi:hypothetical protein
VLSRSPRADLGHLARAAEHRAPVSLTRKREAPVGRWEAVGNRAPGGVAWPRPFPRAVFQGRREADPGTFHLIQPCVGFPRPGSFPRPALSGAHELPPTPASAAVPDFPCGGTALAPLSDPRTISSTVSFRVAHKFLRRVGLRTVDTLRSPCGSRGSSRSARHRPAPIQASHCPDVRSLLSSATWDIAAIPLARA